MACGGAARHLLRLCNALLLLLGVATCGVAAALYNEWRAAASDGVVPAGAPPAPLPPPEGLPPPPPPGPSLLGPPQPRAEDLPPTPWFLCALFAAGGAARRSRPAQTRRLADVTSRSVFERHGCDGPGRRRAAPHALPERARCAAGPGPAPAGAARSLRRTCPRASRQCAGSLTAPAPPQVAAAVAVATDPQLREQLPADATGAAARLAALAHKDASAARALLAAAVALQLLTLALAAALQPEGDADAAAAAAAAAADAEAALAEEDLAGARRGHAAGGALPARVWRTNGAPAALRAPLLPAGRSAASLDDGVVPIPPRLYTCSRDCPGVVPSSARARAHSTPVPVAATRAALLPPALPGGVAARRLRCRQRLRRRKRAPRRRVAPRCRAAAAGRSRSVRPARARPQPRPGGAPRRRGLLRGRQRGQRARRRGWRHARNWGGPCRVNACALASNDRLRCRPRPTLQRVRRCTARV
jgi:hypothetical protein